MPATQTITTVNPTITQASLVTTLKNAFAAAGYPTPYADSTSGTDRILVYQLVFDAAKVYGTSYLRLKVTTALVVQQQLFTAWNITTVTGTNAGGESSLVTFANNLAIEIRTFVRTTEFKLIAMSQGSNYALLGYLRPDIKHSSFDEDTAPYIFQSNNVWNAPFATWQCTALTPYTGGGNTSFNSNMNNGSLASANPITNKRDVLAGMLLLSGSGQGIAAKTSDDCVSVAANGLSRFDPIQVTAGTEEYILLFPGNGTLAIRTV